MGSPKETIIPEFYRRCRCLQPVRSKNLSPAVLPLTAILLEPEDTLIQPAPGQFWQHFFDPCKPRSR